MKFNLYKLDLINIEELENFFSERDYFCKSEKIFDSVIFKIYINEKERENKPWLEEIIDFFKLDLNEYDLGKIYNGILVIIIENNYYGVPFGYSYHLLKEKCDPSFGLDFAELELEDKTVDNKRSEYIQSNKLKENTTFKPGNIFNYEPGESFNLLTGQPKDVDLFGKRIECGFSIKMMKDIRLREEDDLEKIITIIRKIEEIISQENPEKSIIIPRVNRIKKKDEKNDQLNTELLTRIKNDSEMFEVFLDDLSSYYENSFSLIGRNTKLIYNSNEKDFEEFDVDNLLDFIKEFNVENIYKIFFKINDLIEEEIQKEKIINFLLIEMKFDNINYIFSEGFWGIYNQSYVNLLDNELKRISSNIILNEYKIKEFENEDKYIESLKNNYKGIQLHRIEISLKGDSLFRVSNFELADFYSEEENELLAIKIGKNNQNLCYVFDQAIIAVNVLKNREELRIYDKLKEKISKEEIPKILNSNKYSILLILKQKSYSRKIKEKSFNLTDLGSLILKLKIVYWDNFMRHEYKGYNLYFEPGIEL